jgi:nucleoside 2-deoxyribosyltransferase
MTVYLSGPMTNQPDFGRKEFNAAEAALRAKGFKALNPACLPTDLDAKSYMPICLTMLREADAVVTLKGWEHSKGASLEVRYADALLMPVYEFPEALKRKEG